MINYRRAIIEALHNKDLVKLKELTALKGLTIYAVDSVAVLRSITIVSNDEVGFIFSPIVKSFMESQFIAAALDGVEYKYNHLFRPSLSREEVLCIKQQLEDYY